MSEGLQPVSETPARTGSKAVRPRLGVVDKSFYIIGVGASAGGLEAIRRLIMAIPKDWPHSLVIIQHIPPHHKSMMPEILARETALVVCEVEDNMPIEPRHIYLIPPNSNVVIQGTGVLHNAPAQSTEGVLERDTSEGLRFALNEPTPRPQLNLPIDMFFHSLAEAVGDRSIAIILSGTGSDGSLGIRNIKDRDGFVMVQVPTTAEFDGMPASAIGTGIVDLVVAPEAMPEELDRYFDLRDNGFLTVAEAFIGEANTFRKIISLVGESAEIDFEKYKEPTLKRRIARRMAIRNCSSLHEYLALLEEDRGELTVMHREFLVGVTNFFRDPNSWVVLEQTVLPKLFDLGDREDPLKVWCVGCSSGEEAYTVGLLLEYWRNSNDIDREYRIIATDVNEPAIQAAKEGVFPESALEEIPERFRNSKYIKISQGTFEVDPKIRNKIIFTQHNAVDDTPFIDTDLIICRNLMIYLGREIQTKLLTAFSFSLRERGFLFLGASEYVPTENRSFEPLAERNRIFQHTGEPMIRQSRMASQSLAGMSPSLPRLRRLPSHRLHHSEEASELLKGVVSQLEACVVVIDESGGVLETFGKYKQYLSMPDDGYSPSVLDQVDPRIGTAISVLLRRAQNDQQAEKRNLSFSDEQGPCLVSLFCNKVTWRRNSSAFALTISKSRVDEDGNDAPGEERAEVFDSEDAVSARAYIARIESELAASQEMLTSTIEDLGVTNEELQASNEELMAANEELQANNEEVQSVNEELHTVNAENVEKISQLEEAYTDIENLLDDPVVGKILLDNKMNIRRFTTAMEKYVDLRPHDVGRPLANFVTNFHPGTMPNLIEDAKHASETGEESSRELRTVDGDWALAMVRPFRRAATTIDGAIVSLIDVSEIKNLQEALTTQRDLLEGLLESEAAGYWDWDIANDVEVMSPRIKSMFGYADHELENTPAAWQALVHPEDLPLLKMNLDAHIKSGGQTPFKQELRFRHRNGSIIWVVRRGHIIEWDDDGSPSRMLGVHIEITDLKRREGDVHRRAEELRRFAFVASHDLMQPLNTISSKSERFRNTIASGEPIDGSEIDGLQLAVDGMKSRISGVFEYARMQEEDWEITETDLGKVCGTVVKDLDHSIESCGAVVEMRDLPSAMVPPDLAYRVFQNLLGNALKYRRKDVKPRIVVEEGPSTAETVTIRISDNGIGIEPQFRQQVFGLFRKLHTDKEYSGNGLGLALCDMIISRCGGSIWIEDAENGGSVFAFTLGRRESD